MKLLATVLVLVVVMHSQCVNACPVALYLSAVSGEPPCHHHGPEHNSAPNSPIHDNAGCGFGLAVQSQIAGKFKSQFQMGFVYVSPIAVRLDDSIAVVGATLAMPCPPGDSLHSSASLRPILRI